MADTNETESKQELMGTDPLAWLNDESFEQLKQQTADEGNNVVEENPDSGQRIVLEENQTIVNIQELQEKLSKVIADEGRLEIDAAAIEKIDALSLQLLTSFIQTAITSKRQPVWHAQSEAFQNCVRLSGLQSHLGL